MSSGFLSAAATRDALGTLGLSRGDVALVHSDAIVAAQFPPMRDDQRLDVLIESIEAVLGPEGTLVMPTFSYSFTKGEQFDVCQTPSAVGMVSEHFRRKQGVLRSCDPIFSFAMKGRLAPRLSAVPVGECFGPESVFALLHQLNAQIVCVGCSLTRGGTFVHYVERKRGVCYRYDKEFHGTVIGPDRIPTPCSAIYYVRDLRRNSEADLRYLQCRLGATGHLKTAVAGRVHLLAVRADDFFRTASVMLDEDPIALIAEGARNQ